jgi:drug/metabolite transporter (DMT)-like permease
LIKSIFIHLIQKTSSAKFAQLNIAILLISTSGVLGKHIDLPAPLTIGFRSLIAALFIYIYCKGKKFDFKILKEDRKKILLGGILLGGHWVTYFYALQLSNVAIGMLSLFTYPVITTILEPLLLKTKFENFHLLLALFILAGIFFLIPKFDLEHNHTQAIAFGVLSALCYSLRNILLKPMVNTYNGSTLMFFQLTIVSFLLCPLYFTLNNENLFQYVPEICTLALVTTALGHTLFLYSLKYFSAVSVSIMSCLQPVYGTLFGIFLLNEYPNMQTLIGGSFILLAVTAESLRLYFKKETI